MNTANSLIECNYCGLKFKPKRKWHIFCSTGCRVENWYLKNVSSKRITVLEKKIAELEKKLK